MRELENHPHINVSWDALEDAAVDMDTRAASTNSYLLDAHAAWSGLSSAYNHDETQAAVHAALNELLTPVADWHTALGSARTALSDFVATGRTLQAEDEALSSLSVPLRARVNADVEASESSVGTDLAEYNSRARALRTQWDTAQSEVAAALDAISIGTGETLPMSAALGTGTLPTVSWAAFTSALDDSFGPINPAQLLESLRGLTPDELRAWADANPEAAAVLAANKPMGPFAPGSPEQIMSSAMSGNAQLSESGINSIRTAWLGLDLQGQEKLLLLYPAVFGNLNGVPFAQRATANILTVAGYRETVRQQQADLGPEPTQADFTAEAFAQPGHERVQAYNAYYGFAEAHRKWADENTRLQTLAAGLDYALTSDAQIVMLSIEGKGQVVSMNGTPSASTSIAATLVPGTGANLGSLENYSGNLDAIDGAAGPNKVTFYWQGTDLPSEIPDNATSKFNEEGGPLLAAFDHAVDAEIPDTARSTYVGYSAGGSLLGTGEREGLDSTNILYVAPAGTGHDVSSPADTANPDANRYLIQTQDDPIAYAQLLGGGFHGGSFAEGSLITKQMGAVELESGFGDPSNPESVLSGHTSYFTPGSTSAANMRGVIDGTRVSLNVESKIHTGIGYSYVENPLVDRPEEYAYGKLETVSTQSLEK